MGPRIRNRALDSRRGGRPTHSKTTQLPSPAMRKTCAGRHAMRLMANPADTAMTKAPSQQAIWGKALRKREKPARNASRPWAAPNRREGRQSMRKLDDDLDNGLQLRIGGPFEAHAPLPELIVLAVEHA